MSTIYDTEPPTYGKVLVKTTIGDIEIDLWSREAPKACKNFINHCLNKYYNGTIFHRVVKGFIVQGGDPTGTGNGGESFDGPPFPDEFHQRLKFIRRGLVAMANGGPNDNRSQFFITLGPCNDLNKRHTIFGSVVNNTIYNVLKVEEMEISKDGRPSVPPKILKTTVVENPFKDNVSRQDENRSKAEKYVDAFKHVKAVKNTNLLSFGDEEDEIPISKIKSSHDVLDDPSLSKQPVVDPATITVLKEPEKVHPDVPEPIVQQTLEQALVVDDPIMKLKAEQDELKAKLRTTKRKVKMLKEESKKKPPKQELVDENELLAGFGALRKDFTVNETISEYILSNSKYAKRKKVLPILNKTDQRELLTLNMLRDFESELSQLQQKALLRQKERNQDEEVDMETETNWMDHILTFEKPSPYISQALDANVEISDRYDITDPRNPINIRKSGIKPKEK